MRKTADLYKIGELERLTGTPRRTIHFYLEIKLLHPPMKTGKTMAYYDEFHIKKLELINKLKQQGLSLIVIGERVSELRMTTSQQTQKSDDPSIDKKPKTEKKLPQRSHGIKTRENIIKLSTQLFQEKGYNETKINDIIRLLNIGKGSFYFFFNNKQELFIECVPEIFNTFFSDTLMTIRHEKNPLKRFELRMEAVLPVQKEFCSILKLCREVIQDDDPKMKQLGNQILDSIRKPIESDLRKCIEQGLIPDLDPKVISVMLIVIIENSDFIRLIEKDFSLSSVLNLFYLFSEKSRKTIQ